MSIFGPSSEDLRKERERLEISISRKAMELAGKMTPADATVRELLPLTTRLVAIENEIFKKTSIKKLRREQAELQGSLDQLASQIASNDSSDASSYSRQHAARAQIFQIECKIKKIDYHLAHRPLEASPKNVLIVFGIAVVGLLIDELLKRLL